MKSVTKLHAEAVDMQRRAKRPQEIAHELVDRAGFRPGSIHHVSNRDGTIVLRFEDTSEIIRYRNGEWLYESL